MADDLQQNFPAVPRPEPGLKPFAYAPLDHQKRSVRLIRVLATKSKEGRIQCEIRHASVSNSYICLSYVWGEQDCWHTVLLDSKPFKVRSNLFDFLARARQNNRLLGEWLWIDAMCIDQANVGERNHQVQQMGRIYTYAKEVISWFGEDKDSIAAYFVEQVSPSGDAVNHSLTDLCLKFAWAPYWNRAWITQEVQLARKVTLLAKNVEVDYRLLLSANGNLLTTDKYNPHWIVRPRPPSWLPSKRSLICVMSEFGYKRCHDIRDRVYSLLALCDDGSDVQVDYNTSVERLGRHTLECCGRSFCLCSMRIVHDVLHLGQQLSRGPLEDGSSKPFAYMTLPYYQGGLPSRKCTSKPCQVPKCDGTEWSHISGFVHQASHNDDPSITIYPSRICRSAFHNLTRIEMVAVGESRYRCDKVGFDMEKHYTRPTPKFLNEDRARTWWWSPPQKSRHHHLTLIPTGDTCRIEFQFSSLIEIARDSAEADPCGVVRTQRAKLDQSALRLSSSLE